MSDDRALLPRHDAVSIYTIYDHPRDHPDWWVVRPHDVIGGQSTPREVCGLFSTLDKARAYCAQFGLVCVQREPGDDPTIVECWL